MILSFHPCFIADQQIILGDRSLNETDYSQIHQAEAIILPQSCSHTLYQACKKSPALLFPNYDVRFKYPGKKGQTRLFQHIGLRYPETLLWGSVDAFCKAIENLGHLPHTMPFLIKVENFHEGDGIYLIETIESLKSALEKIRLLERPGCNGFISQVLMPSKGNVLRVVVIHHYTMTYWKRPRNPDTVITTVNRGAVIDPDWRKDLREKGLMEAAKFFRITGINLASVDFIFPFNETDPEPFFLEINYYFGRRGLGGSLRYYSLLFEAIQEWLKEKRLDPQRVSIV